MAKKQEVADTQIVDINLSEIQKKKFRIDGDDNKILALNTSDLNILSRLKESYPKLVNLTNEAINRLPENFPKDEENPIESEEVNNLISVLKEIDMNMRKQVDYIFDSNVSEICAQDGSMYDPINGKFRYEHIIDTLADLYADNISTGMNKIAKRVWKHTDKYIGK